MQIKIFLIYNELFLFYSSSTRVFMIRKMSREKKNYTAYITFKNR